MPQKIEEMKKKSSESDKQFEDNRCLSLAWSYSNCHV